MELRLYGAEAVSLQLGILFSAPSAKLPFVLRLVDFCGNHPRVFRVFSLIGGSLIKEGCLRKCWQPEEAQSLDPVFYSRKTFLPQRKQTPIPPHLPPLPLEAQVGFEIQGKGFRCSLILAQTLILVILRVYAHYPIPTKNLIKVMCISSSG